ncbi:PH domain-containing protein [Kocuria massiliensis]|uniref:PH domain-containing protein n=1 Tax=Kocuria massiliensis TaxID=1926282 RepID=UPI000A1CB88C|nr:PH domain-containing protein [Kocuria massiliensis]
MPDTETIDGPLESTPEHPRLGPGGPKFEARLRSLDAWDTEWIRPDRRFLQVLLLSEAINGLIGVVLLCIPLILVMTGIWTWPWLWLAILVPALLAASVVINMMLTPRRARAHGYVEREEDLLVRRGVIRHRVNAIPYGRLQYVEVSVGPIDRIFGLATVEIHTASSSTDSKIRGICANDAARLREDLSRRGDDRLAGL